MMVGSASAFTLIELLLVLVILAVLAAVATPIYLRQAEKAREDATRADISNIKTALDTFALNNGRYPTSEEGLLALVRAPAGMDETWNGPYLEQFPHDKWGNEYFYAYPSDDDPRTYALTSPGKDHQMGTEDDITRYSVANVPAPVPGGN
jgi:general secretion pathway protein G